MYENIFVLLLKLLICMSFRNSSKDKTWSSSWNSGLIFWFSAWKGLYTLTVVLVLKDGGLLVYSQLLDFGSKIRKMYFSKLWHICWRMHRMHLYSRVNLTPASVLYITINYPIERLQSWRFEECGVLPRRLLSELLLPVLVPSMCQTQLFNLLRRIIMVK